MTYKALGPNRLVSTHYELKLCIIYYIVRIFRIVLAGVAMFKCLKCNNPTKNPKFCSRSCSASYSNFLKPKRKKTFKSLCCICNNEIYKSRNKYCVGCRPTTKDWSKVKISDLINLRKYQIYSRIRELARKSYYSYLKLNNLQPCCTKCGYSKHIEVCHIKPIKSFPKDSYVSEVNQLENLIGLCPNCHWEFDNKL